MTPRGEATVPDRQPTGDAAGLRRARSVVRSSWQALLFALAAAAVAYLASSVAPPSYTATTTLLVLQPSANYLHRGLLTPPQLDPETYVAAVRQGPVARQALRAMLGRAPSEHEVGALRRGLRIDVVGKAPSSMLRLRLAGPDPAAARSAVNAVANALVSWDASRASVAIRRSIDALQGSYDSIRTRLTRGPANGEPLGSASRATLVELQRQRAQQLARARALSRSMVAVGLLEPLTVATAGPAVPASLAGTEALVAGLVGLLGGLLMLYLRGSAGGAPSESSLALAGLPVLTQFPVPTQSAPDRSAGAADYLRAHLLRTPGATDRNVIAVTSPRTAAEKAGVAASLAASLVRAGYRTLLVDADLRRPRNLRATAGAAAPTSNLEMHLENPRLDYSPEVLRVSATRTCDFIPGAPATAYPVELLQRGLGPRLTLWRRRYDFVVLDCPPVLPFLDSLVIAPLCGGVVVCAGRESSERLDLLEAVTRLHDRGGTLLGTVVTAGRPPPRRGRRVGRRVGTGAGAPATAGAGSGGAAAGPQADEA